MRVSEQVLEATDNITPRSALRYRPIAGDSTPPPIVTTASIPVVQRASRPRQVGEMMQRKVRRVPVYGVPLLYPKRSQRHLGQKQRSPGVRPHYACIHCCTSVSV